MDRNISDRAADTDPARLEPGRHILHIRSMLHPIHADHVESNTGNRRQNPRRNRSLLDSQEIMHAKNKNPSQKTFQEGFDVLRTGIELYVIISKLSYLQAVLQAVENFLIFYACLHDRFNVRSLSNDLVKILSKRYFIRQTF